MKLKFKVQPYQTSAVESVVDCFAGQVKTPGIAYRIDPGVNKKQLAQGPILLDTDIEQTGFKNADIQLTDAQLLANIQAVQRRQNLPLSQSLEDFHVKNDRKDCYVPAPDAYKKLAKSICGIHLDIEMETGTGKTYCYIKTIFEMNKRYGWSKFIVVVPSINFDQP